MNRVALVECMLVYNTNIKPDEGLSNIQVLARQTEHAFDKEGTPKGKNKASVLVGFQNLKEVQVP